MEVGDHLFQAGGPARHITQQVILVAVVDSDVGIGVPDQDGVDSAVALPKVVKVTVHGVSARRRVVEVAVLDHHLRLDEA